MDLTPTIDQLYSDNQTWLASDHGLDDGRGVTLHAAAFTSGTHYPNGFFPSGLPLGRITASGLYGPYAGNVSEAQTLTSTATGGTITLKFDGELTGTISSAGVGFTAALVQTALEGLSNIQPGDVVVTGAAGGPLTVTFAGQWVGQNVPQLVVDNTSATGGTIVAATATGGGSGSSDGTEVFAGFLLTPMKPGNPTTNDVQGVLLDHGIVIEANLPIAVDAAAKSAASGRIIFR